MKKSTKITHKLSKWMLCMSIAFLGTVNQEIYANNPVPPTQLTGCNQIVSDLSGSFHCDIVAGAQDYQWQFSVSPGGAVVNTITRGSGVNTISKSLVTGLKLGVAYDVVVRAKVAGLWGTFGVVPCVITMGTPTTQLKGCDQTVNDLSGNFYCDAITGAQDYLWQFTTHPGGAIVKTITRGSGVNSISKTLITGLQMGAQYDVAVRVKVGGVWGAFGNTCVLTMGSTIPSVQLITNDCQYSSTDMSGNFYCTQITGAEDYEWQFTPAGSNPNGAVQVTKKHGSGVNSMNKLSVGLVQDPDYGYYGYYYIAVRVKLGGVWGQFSAANDLGRSPVFGCFVYLYDGNLIVPNDPERGAVGSVNNSPKVNSQTKLQIFPNPSTNSGFNVNLKGVDDGESNIIVDVYDMYGKRVWTENISNKKGDQIAKINENGSLANGVYLIKVNANGQLLQQKIIIQ